VQKKVVRRLINIIYVDRKIIKEMIKASLYLKKYLMRRNK
jgi:hypothetical protein